MGIIIYLPCVTLTPTTTPGIIVEANWCLNQHAASLVAWVLQSRLNKKKWWRTCEKSYSS